MNVTELRTKLEEMEQQGNGHCRVEVAPAPPPLTVIQGGNIPGIDFAAEDYGVTEVFINPWQQGTAITLIFTELDLESASTEP